MALRLFGRNSNDGVAQLPGPPVETSPLSPWVLGGKCEVELVAVAVRLSLLGRSQDPLRMRDLHFSFGSRVILARNQAQSTFCREFQRSYRVSTSGSQARGSDVV